MEWNGIKGAVFENVPMSRYTSMRVGGPARYLVYPVNEDDLLHAVMLLRDEGIPYRIMGNGTNIIVNDNGIDEALIRITRIRSLKYAKGEEKVSVDVSGGFSLKRFIEENAKRSVAGLERLYWIPGTVGGAVKMNAGSFGASVSDVLDEVRVLNGTGSIRKMKVNELSMDYRTSPFRKGECVVGARFSLSHGDAGEIRKEMSYVYSERKKRHPMEFPSAGSVFKSVQGEPAWKCIDRAGLRGARIGDACLSEKHANFIVNMGAAKAADVKSLIDRIKKVVFESSGICLEEEVELWGFYD